MLAHHRASIASCLGVLLIAGCAPPGGDDAPDDALSATARAKVPPDLPDALAAGHATQLLLVIDDGPVAAARGAWPDAKRGVEALAEAGGATIDDRWDALPIVPMTVDGLGALAQVLDDPRVISATPVARYQAFDAESFPLISQPTAAAVGKIGAGTTVAVLDTGVDYVHPAFGCTSPGVPAGCKVAVARDFAVEDGARDASGHGTNVAGIVVGVAPGARVLGLDVFDGSSASSATILAAYNWVLQNRATYNVAAVNLSLGGGSFTAPCPGDPLAVAFATGRTAGVVTAVASGNNATLNAIASPACAPDAVSVGAVYDANVGGIGYTVCTDPVTAADRVACFSNSATFLKLLAPGALIDAAGFRMAGTSQATPHVAGAAAVLRAAFPAESASQLITRMVSGGRAVVDPRTSRTTPRLDLARALSLTSPDGTPPVGTVVINAGATYTRTRAVTLTLAATDASGVADLCIGDPCGAFVPYATTVATTMPTGADGTRTVAVRFRDRAGNIANPVTDTIVLDTIAPGLTLSGSTSGGRVAWTWSGADATSGVASYRLVVASGTTAPPAGCATGTLLAQGTTTSFTHGPLAVGSTWSYRLCATDRAGNTAGGLAITVVVR